jgi:nucleoside-diphosphate-sugar epimerase
MVRTLNSRHLVTGATGFIGGAIVLELLARTEAEVCCLVRAQNQASAQSRLVDSLKASARAYGRRDLLPSIRERCRAFPGDITRPLCGEEAVRTLPAVAEVWHCAASLRYADRDGPEIFRHNVDGTRHALDLAAAIGAQKFNHLSTAYVAGTRQGMVLEGPPSAETPTANLYEASKLQAEILVAGAEGFGVRVLRPSVVIGHSQTFASTSFTGIYGFMRELMRFKRAVSARLGSYLSHRSLCITADPDTELNLIPVDFVARNAVRISASASEASVFHLTNSAPPTVGELLRQLFRILRMKEPRFVTSADDLTSIDAVLNRRLKFYRSYMASPKVFDRTHTDAACGVAASACPLDSTALESYARWYLPRLKELPASGELPPARRGPGRASEPTPPPRGGDPR